MRDKQLQVTQTHFPRVQAGIGICVCLLIPTFLPKAPLGFSQCKETKQAPKPSARQQAMEGTQPHTTGVDGARGWLAFRGAARVSAGSPGIWNSACEHPESNPDLFIAALPTTCTGQGTTGLGNHLLVLDHWAQMFLCSVSEPCTPSSQEMISQEDEMSGTWSHEKPLRAVGPYGLTGTSLCLQLSKLCPASKVTSNPPG